jgi:hypothetical protein
MIVAATAGTLQLVTAIQLGMAKQNKPVAAIEERQNARPAYGAL